MSSFLNKKLNILLPILSGDSSLPRVAHEKKLAPQELERWLKSLLGRTSLREAQSGFIIRKNPQGTYLWHNENAKDLWHERSSRVGLTDYDMTPDMADSYRRCDLETMRSGQRRTFTDKVEFCRLGHFEARAKYIPVSDEFGRPDGIILFSHLEFNLGAQPFELIIRLLRSPRSYGLLRADNYMFSCNDMSVSFSRREAEVALNVMVGISARKIAETMRTSIRTAQSYIESAKAKLGVRTSNDLVAALLDSTFLAGI